MKRLTSNLPKQQQGSLLLEGLIGLLMFLVGILGLMSVQAAAIRNASDATYRAEAALLANKLISEMWISDTKTPGALAAKFSSPSGTNYVSWFQDIKGNGDGLSGLPGAEIKGNEPTVTIDNTNTATVTVFWQPPNASGEHHSYRVIAQINN